MDIDILNIEKTVTEVGVKIELAKILHNAPFRDPNDRTPLLNFDMRLVMRTDLPKYHQGKGRLTIGNKAVAQRFLELYGTQLPRTNGSSGSNYRSRGRARGAPSRPSSRQAADPPLIVVMAGKTLRFTKFSDRPSPRRTEELNTLPFVDPVAEQKEKELEKDLGDPVPFHILQFGRRTRAPDGSFTNTFSVEWEVKLSPDEKPSIGFKVPTREIEILFNKSRYPDNVPYAIVVPWTRILSLIWDDGSFSGQPPSAVFHLEVAPSFERLPDIPGHGTRLKLNFLPFHDDSSHASLAPYISTTLRLVFHPSDVPALVQLRDACKRAIPFAVKKLWTNVNTVRYNLFEKLDQVETWLSQLDLRIALQCSALYMNGYLDALELLCLRPRIEALIRRYQDDPDGVAWLLSNFGARLRTIQHASLSMRVRSNSKPESLLESLDAVLKEELKRTKKRHARGGLMQACAAIITPTSIHLEGPYMDQSNSVLRKYPNHQHYFLRLKFANEDHLPLYNDRNVDSRLFVKFRVGNILREGVDIGGRHFEFLAYSLSALRQHSVWMVSPFMHPTSGLVNAETIRDSLGDFSAVIMCPARYGARLAQAFTATEPSIILRPEQIQHVDDKVHKASGAVFTDGVGTMSLEILDLVWNRLVENRPHHRKTMDFPATVFQIRRGGDKGLLFVDPLISGAVIRVRPSMNKFDAPDSLGLEIAKSFENPRPFFLNRPFIMLLESRGISIDIFLNLQRDAVSEIEMATSSLLSASRMVETYGLGSTFRMRSLLRCIHDVLSLDFGGIDEASLLEEPFLRHILTVGKANALRDIRFRARIPVPQSWTLIGIADEYDVLRKDEIYACVQKNGSAEPLWLKGPAIVTKSPSLGPGDAQFVTAIGKPPPDSPFLKGPFPVRNCVVFSCRGSRPLPSMLGGGDLDGDEFNVVQYEPLFPEESADPDDFLPAPRNELDRPCEINDVVDFVIDYINNDLVGRLASEHLVLADQHADGVFYANCQELARLYALSLDFTKSGTPIDLDNIPKLLNDMRPDYMQREHQVGYGSTKFYPSQRALGYLFREPELQVDFEALRFEMEPSLADLNMDQVDRLHDRVKLLVSRCIEVTTVPPSAGPFERYAEELLHICSTTGTGPHSDVILEGEAVMGVILAKAPHNKIRQDRVHRLRIQMADLASSIRDEFDGSEDDSKENKLRRAYEAWAFARTQGRKFGARSYGLIALGSIFAYVEKQWGITLDDLKPTSIKHPDDGSVSTNGHSKSDELGTDPEAESGWTVVSNKTKKLAAYGGVILQS